MNSSSSVRVRFAPSPTGHLHIGGLRTALFNWLYARHNNGVYLVRIEDTDLERSKDEFTQSILDSFKWVGITPDEPLLIQSSRVEEHKKLIAQLVEQGKAYRCYCTDEEITARRGQTTQGLFYKYDGFCRTRPVTPELAYKPFGVRFKLPDGVSSVSWNDLIRGTVTIESGQLDDYIIARSDGWPLYNFVVVADDAFQKITHVFRGEEHIPNTPKQILLYQALGYPIPQFAHLSMILGPDGNKLSKRDAATAVIDYKYNGYLPEALINYLVRLGWAHGDQEVFTRDEMINYFDVDAIGKKGAIFDQQKLDWMNTVYLRAMNDADIMTIITRDIDSTFTKQLLDWSSEQILSLIALYKQRLTTLKQLVQEITALYKRPAVYDQADIVKWITPQTSDHLRAAIDGLKNIEQCDAVSVQAMVKQIIEQLNIKIVQLAQPMRIALIGKSSGPGVFELIAILKKEESLARLQQLLTYIQDRA